MKSYGTNFPKTKHGSAMDEFDYIPLSRLSHAGYCLRRAALLTNEDVWTENADTAKGREEHRNVHNQRIERRGDHINLYDYEVFSDKLEIRGKCCLPEFFVVTWICIRRLYGGDFMVIVITYDVNTTEDGGVKRLRKVARLCERYGIRVQNSVFEVTVDAAQLVVLKSELSKTIDHENDSVRFYKLGNSYQQKIETMGKVPIVQTGGALIL